MMSTFVAPVAARMESTVCWITAAVVAFDCRQVHDQFTSSAYVHPSALNRLTIVLHVALVPLYPWMKRTGSWVGVGLGGFGGLPPPPRAKSGETGARGLSGESAQAATE